MEIFFSKYVQSQYPFDLCANCLTYMQHECLTSNKSTCIFSQPNGPSANILSDVTVYFMTFGNLSKSGKFQLNFITNHSAEESFKNQSTSSLFSVVSLKNIWSAFPNDYYLLSIYGSFLCSLSCLMRFLWAVYLNYYIIIKILK